GTIKGRLATTGFPVSYTDGNGQTWSATYDAQGSLKSLTAPSIVTGTLGGGVQLLSNEWTYDAFNQVSAHKHPDGRITTYTYYSAGAQNGRLHQVTEDSTGSALTTTFEYDPFGHLTKET